MKAGPKSTGRLVGLQNHPGLSRRIFEKILSRLTHSSYETFYANLARPYKVLPQSEDVRRKPLPIIEAPYAPSTLCGDAESINGKARKKVLDPSSVFLWSDPNLLSTSGIMTETGRLQMTPL